MSVLYPFTLRRNYTRSRPGRSNSVTKFVFFFLIAGIPFNGLFAQEVSKEEQTRKEAELKKEEAARLETKLKANPDITSKARLSTDKQTTVHLSGEEEKQLMLQKQAEETAKIAAEKKNISLPGVEYKIVTTGNEVEYVVTNARREIYRQTIALSASVYQKQVVAEKEAIYATNTLRRNINYPVDALKAEIKSLSFQ